MASLPSSENTHQITSFDNLPDIAQEVAYDVCQVRFFKVRIQLVNTTLLG